MVKTAQMFSRALFQVDFQMSSLNALYRTTLLKVQLAKKSASYHCVFAAVFTVISQRFS